MRSRLTATMLVLLCLSILLPMRGAERAEAAGTNAPVLLIVNSAAPNKLGPYLGEILRAEGLNAFDQVALTSVTAAQLGAIRPGDSRSDAAHERPGQHADQLRFGGWRLAGHAP